MRHYIINIRIAFYLKKKKKPQKTASFGMDVEKFERLYVPGVGVKWCSHNGKQLGGSSNS